MTIKYIFKQDYLDKLKKAETDQEFDDLLSWSSGSLIFEDNEKSTKNYEINPDVFYWWLDRVIGQFKNEKFEVYDEDICGLMLYIHWKNDLFTIYTLENKNKKNIFEIKITKNKTAEEFIHLAKRIKEEVEKTNPLVKKQKIWNDYYFTSHNNK